MGMLTPEEAAAVRLYSGPAYRRINESLRGEQDMDDSVRSIIAALDGAISKSTLSMPLTLYRGIDGDGASYIRDQGLRVGSVLSEVGFMSTSLSPSAAGIFSIFPPGGFLLKVHAPTGSLALDMTDFSLFPAEQEFLLPRDTRLRVIAYDPSSRTIEAEVA
jgi:hypothetical protein